MYPNMRKLCLIAVLLLALFSTVLAQDGQVYHGKIDDSTPSQDYSVTLKSGDAVLITTTTPDTSKLDTVLTLYDPEGKVISTNDDANVDTQDSQVAAVAAEDGTYKITVTRYDNSTDGDYQLDVKVGDESLLAYDVHMSGKEQTQDTEHFRFHYTVTGADVVKPPFLAAIERAFENAWHVEIDKLGWPKPPSDGVMGGGKDLYDVYVIDVVGSPDEALGITSPEGEVADNPNTPEVEQWAAASYIEIDNDFHNIDFLPGQDAVTVMRSTAIHEFHHAIQMGYDAQESHSWLAEATSTWMESVAAGKDQDATGYVETAYQYPELCFGTTQDSSIMYGEWPFMELLTDDFGADAVMNLWKQIVNYEGFDALDHYLKTVGTDVPHELARYRIKNLARDYKLAPEFKATVWLENTISGPGEWSHSSNIDGVQELGANYLAFAAAKGVYDIELSGDENKLEVFALGVAKDRIDSFALGRGGVIDTSAYQYTYLMVFNPTYDNDISDCSSVDYKLEITRSRGMPAAVDTTWNRQYFEPLKIQK